MSTLPPLARVADFPVADAKVRPSIRTIEGPGGNFTVEPKVMQVLVAFAAARGATVTRDDLIRDCWDGRIVGEDAVNRTIASLRRALRDTRAGASIETIPRIGYRLQVSLDERPENRSMAWGPAWPVIGRRGALLGAAAGVTGISLAAIGLDRRTDPADQVGIETARRALFNGFPDSGDTAAASLQRVIRSDPHNAEAWGLLAYAYRDIAEGASPDAVSAAVQARDEVATRALALDPTQGTALAARAMLRPYFGDFGAAEDRLDRVLRIDPDNVLAMMQLVALLQGVGRVRQSALWNDRMLKLDPQSPVGLYRRATKAWSVGDDEMANQAADRAMQLWPLHPGVWNARMMIFAFGGRPDAGLAMLADSRIKPRTLKQPGVDLWRISLQALSTRTPKDIDRAKAANLAAAPRSPGFANNALMTLSSLGEIDAAFMVADGYFLSSGPLIASMWSGAGELPVSALRWRRTMALFIPPTAAMRADPRFDLLAEGMGLARYWNDREIVPDYRRLV